MQLPPVQNAVTSQTSYAVIRFLPSHSSPEGRQPSAAVLPPVRPEERVLTWHGVLAAGMNAALRLNIDVLVETPPNPIDRKRSMWSLFLTSVSFLPACSIYLLSLSKVFVFSEAGQAFCDDF